MNQLVGSIVEIAHSKLVRYRGNWDSYVEQKAAREEQQLAAYKNQQKEIAALQLFADRFRAKASKASQAQSKLKQIDRMKKIAAPVARGKTIKFHFPQPVRSGLRVITLKDIDHAYGDLVVYRGLQYHAERCQRTVLVGPNGAGKSTLLKLLAGVLPVQHGVRELGHNVRTGYFSQNRIDVLNASHTVLDSARDMPNPVSEQTARTVLGSFLFRGDDVFKTVAVLSGGEKSRLALVRLLLDPPNLLLMDEPTTHLDVGSIDALIGALKQYHGTLIFISHDVHFIRAIATSVLHVTASSAGAGGRLTFYPGDYDYYLDKSKAASAKAGLVGTDRRAVRLTTSDNGAQRAGGSRKQKEQKRLEAEARNAIARARREKEKRVHELETKNRSLGRTTERTSRGAGRSGDLPTGRQRHYNQSRSLGFDPRSRPPDGGMGKRHRHGECSLTTGKSSESRSLRPMRPLYIERPRSATTATVFRAHPDNGKCVFWRIDEMFADNCHRLEEMNNSANVKIEMTAEQIFKEIEALPRSERERLVQRMRESADIPQDFIDALDDFNQQRFVSMETALNETPPDA